MAPLLSLFLFASPANAESYDFCEMKKAFKVYDLKLENIKKGLPGELTQEQEIDLMLYTPNCMMND